MIYHFIKHEKFKNKLIKNSRLRQSDFRIRFTSQLNKSRHELSKEKVDF